MKDRALLELLQTDRDRGMEILLQQYRPLLQYVIRGILSDPQDQEDCFSEVSLLLWKTLDRYDGAKGSLSTWLTVLTRNTALNHLKNHRQDTPLADIPSEPADPDTPEQALLRKERMEKLKHTLSNLSEKERQLFYRKYYYLQSTAQIAAEMGLTERAVEGRLYRLRQHLYRELGGDGL